MRYRDQQEVRPALGRRRQFGTGLVAFLVFLQVVLAFNPGTSTAAPVMQSISGAAYQVQITTDGKPNSNRVGPPANFHRSGPRPTSTVINVAYTGFDAFPAAQAAFQYAVDIWSTQINSSVPISVTANWGSLGSGCGGTCTILGSAGPSLVFRDFTNAPQPGTFYAKALANSLAGSDLASTYPDIQASFNKDYANWYFGTDGNVPAGQIDFSSVVLHELGHGLGFVGSMQVSSGSGKWGLGTPTYPLIYDRFTYNGSNQALLDTSLFPNPSTALATQLQSNNIFFSGPNTNAANGNAPAKLYAPASWQQGSSYSHLDETTYNGTPNALMTPAIGTGEVEHSPGPVMLGIFKDMGWSLASQPPSAPTNLSATAASTTSIGLSWTNPAGTLTALKVERGTSAAGPFSPIAQLAGTATSYTDTGLTASTTYYYRVRASNSGGDSGYSNVASATTLTAPPGAPTNLTATTASATGINLSWTNPAGTLTGIKIERGTAAAGPFSQITQVAGTATSYNDTGLTPNTTYYYRVWATNVGGDSGYSNVANATTLPSVPNAPTNLTAVASSSTQIDLSWTNPAGPLTAIKIERGSAAAGPFTEITQVNPSLTTYSDTGLNPSTTYYYRIRATNAGGDSGYSNVANATTNTPPVSLIVKIPTDGGDAVDQDTPDTLSYALQRVTADQSITFQLNGGGSTVTVTGALRAVPSGANIFGGACGTTGITIKGTGVTAGGLTLNKNILTNLKVSGFGGNQIVTSAPGSLLRCTIASKF